MQTGMIEVAPLAFMRGRTLSNAVVLLDEAQNATSMQMKMFLTRLGEGSRMIINGDPSQTDLPPGQKSGPDRGRQPAVGRRRHRPRRVPRRRRRASRSRAPHRPGLRQGRPGRPGGPEAEPMSLTVDLAVEDPSWTAIGDLQSLVERAVAAALVEAGVAPDEDAEISCLFCDDDAIRALNAPVARQGQAHQRALLPDRRTRRRG